MSDEDERPSEENPLSSAEAAEEEEATEMVSSQHVPGRRAQSIAKAAAAWRFATGRPWTLPLATGLAALLIGGVIGYLLHPDPTASEEYLGMIEDRDAQMEQVEAGREREDELREELRPLKEQAAEFDDRESELDDRESSLDDREEDLDQREEEISETEASIEANTFPGNGTYLVGEDIKAGTYRSSGSDNCYWARLSGTDGEFDSIITNSIGAGAQVVTIHAGDVAFETSQCGQWTRSD